MGCFVCAASLSREPNRLRARGHHRRGKLVRLVERRRLDVQRVRDDARERRVVEHDDRVRVFDEALEREHRVVRLHDDIALARQTYRG